MSMEPFHSLLWSVIRNRGRERQSLHEGLHEAPVRVACRSCRKFDRRLAHPSHVPLVAVCEAALLVADHRRNEEQHPFVHRGSRDEHLDIVACEIWLVLIKGEPHGTVVWHGERSSFEVGHEVAMVGDAIALVGCTNEACRPRSSGSFSDAFSLLDLEKLAESKI